MSMTNKMTMSGQFPINRENVTNFEGNFIIFIVLTLKSHLNASPYHNSLQYNSGDEDYLLGNCIILYTESLTEARENGTIYLRKTFNWAHPELSGGCYTCLTRCSPSASSTEEEEEEEEEMRR